MKQHNILLQLLVLIAVLFISCEKDPTPEPEPNFLFSVDLDVRKFDEPFYKKAYVAAYTAEGELIDYGSLSDSIQWKIDAFYEKDKIDIVYFEINRENSLQIYHIRNVEVGQTFTDPKLLETNPIQYEPKSITLKVENFGNHKENTTNSTIYQNSPYKHHRGYSQKYGEFFWDKIETDFTYKKTYLHPDPDSQGYELTIFEKGTNKPYVNYLDIPIDNINPGDTITLYKTDFTPGELKTININSSHNNFNNIFLTTYNTIDGADDLITSFHDLTPYSSNEKSVKYISSDILPIDRWSFSYAAYTAKTTSYSISSNKIMPTAIDIQEITGASIINLGSQLDFTHGDIFPNKNLVRSELGFSKRYNGVSFHYSFYFEGSESLGNIKITPFQIPDEILDKYIYFHDLNNQDWETYGYEQRYTNLPKNSPLDFLKYSLLSWRTNSSSSEEYYNESFSLQL